MVILLNVLKKILNNFITYYYTYFLHPVKSSKNPPDRGLAPIWWNFVLHLFILYK